MAFSGPTYLPVDALIEHAPAHEPDHKQQRFEGYLAPVRPRDTSNPSLLLPPLPRGSLSREGSMFSSLDAQEIDSYRPVTRVSHALYLPSTEEWFGVVDGR